MINKGLYSSKTDLWSTPQHLFDELNQKYNFTLDPCSTDENHKCEKYYTEDDNGLVQPWYGRVFMNPPYGREIIKWMEKAYNEYNIGNAEVIVCLVPSRTDTKWWHEYSMKGEITFIRGRLKFGNSKNSAPFPSAIVVYGGLEK